MTDGGASAEMSNVVFVEYLRYESESFLRVLLKTVVCNDARSLLSAVLEGVESVVGGQGGVTFGEPYSNDAAFLLHDLSQLSPALFSQLYDLCFEDLPKPQFEQRFFDLW